MAADRKSPVHLGFCEPVQDDDVHHVAHRSPRWSDWDGGQVGGRPSWLNPRHLPQTLRCTQCIAAYHTDGPLRFVCQLYAPADAVNPNAFHRTLYVFACPTCSGIRVVRAQLAHDNAYYPCDDDDDDDDKHEDWKMHLPETHNVKLCQVCGQRGKGTCPLQKVSFCSKQHQKEHKQCVFEKDKPLNLPSVYPMYELVVEEEPNANVGCAENRDTLFQSNNNNDGNDSDEDLEQDDLNRMTGSNGGGATNKDAMTDEFFVRIERAKDQCVRYHQWHESSPLWLQSNPVPSAVPGCSYCGAPRKFEFQIMPQILHYLKRHEEDSSKEVIPKQQKQALLAASTIVEQTDPKEIPAEFKETHDKAMKHVQSQFLSTPKKELDWGVVVVYTCTASCGDSEDTVDEAMGTYREEYAWVQPSLG